ncbi:hypothetical protein [Nocardia wallacei]|uniref:hypothetical protein n=1 Tax=Nocardia wallacei TaxID=480035 RepID=UPI002457D79E|nr:hypothetical protein [Nocardia wallacei]
MPRHRPTSERPRHRTTELDSARAVWFIKSGEVRVLSFQVLGGLAVRLGADSVPLDRCRTRWPEHKYLWMSIETTAGLRLPRET